MFSWDDAHGNDSRQLLKFLKDVLKIEWVEKSKIGKSDDGKTITVTNGEKSLIFKLNENKKENRVTLEISGGKTYEYILNKENDKLNIYTIFMTTIRVRII